MPTIYIDDKAYEVPDGENVLKACLSAGIDLPYFCWHPEMGSVGACRQCALVQFRDEEDTRGRIVMGCMTPVSDGARFSMNGESASEFRENVVESLMLNHPHDCPVCAEGGECHLQDMTVMVGHRDRRYRGKKNTHNNQYLGPLINHEMNRCISCYRCTRYYNDYAGGTDLSAQAAHDHVYFGRQEDGILESPFAGNLVEVCPTGVFTDKPLVNDYTRKWDLQSAPSVCAGCAVGCNTLAGERYGQLKRIHNRYNDEVNGYFLCDRGRYGGNFVNDESRAQFPGLKDSSGRYDAINSQQALEEVAKWCAEGSRVVGIGSPRASLESNFLLREIVGTENFNSGVADHESALISAALDQLQNGSVTTPSLRKAETADAVFVLGEDVTNTAPRLALALRQSVRNLAKEMASEMRIPLWQDEAVRVLAQDRLSPLYIVACTDTPLDDVAVSSTSMNPRDTARLGFAVAAVIDASLPNVEGLSADMQALAQTIAIGLSKAKRPLIVSGTGSQSIEVIQAASAVAHALKNTNSDGSAMLSYCVPEVNSMGVGMLSEASAPSIEYLSERASNGMIDTLVVLENDLYRRAPKALVDTLLNGVKKLIVLDATDSATASSCDLLLPSASFAECEGTVVSNEGRAQRHYPVFLPAEQRQASWNWLLQMGTTLARKGFENLLHFDQVTELCANDCAPLAKIGEASPAGNFRNKGMKIPRQTHRNSGRTAMRSNISVHEPKQPEDNETPFSFSMEGVNSKQPGSLIPFVWSPGWNSNQSVHKFQSEAGGPIAGGTAGVRLIEAKDTSSAESNADNTVEAYKARANRWELVPLYRIFGSDELSAQSPAVNELVENPFVQLNEEDANSQGFVGGDMLSLISAAQTSVIQLQINNTIPSGCAGYSVGLPGTSYLSPATSVTFTKHTGGTA